MKARIAVLALAVISIVLVSGCTTEAPKPKCSDYAQRLIPGNLTLVRYSWSNDKEEYLWAYVGNDKTGLSGNYVLNWNDGSVFDTKTSCYMRGTSVGQNVSQYYNVPCSGSTKVPLQYTKTVIDSTGIIKGTTKFSITPQLREIPGTEGRIVLFRGDTKEYVTMGFEIISKKFSTCTWVNETGGVIDDFAKKE